MYPTNAAIPLRPAVLLQLNIFGGVDEIPVNPPKHQNASTPDRQQLHDTPAPEAQVRNPAPIKQSNPKQGKRERLPTPADELLVDPDDPESVDLEAIEASDTPETILAKRMFQRMMWDIGGKQPEEEVEPDLFGQTSVAGDKNGQADMNRLDALIWLYGLNPDGSLVSIEWVCDVIGFDPHRVRRIVGRSLRKELKRLVHLLSTILGTHHAQVCEDKISDYLDISSWSAN